MSPIKVGFACGATLYLLGQSRFVNLTENPKYDAALFGSMIAVTRIGMSIFFQYPERFFPQYEKVKQRFELLSDEKRAQFYGATVFILGVSEVVIQKNLMNYLESPISYTGFLWASGIGGGLVKLFEGNRAQRFDSQQDN